MRLSVLPALVALLLATSAVGQFVPGKNITARAQVSGPVPANDPGTWVRTEDYPDWAIEHDTTGRVGLRVEVDLDGRATRCDITRSSGVADLDTIACKKVVERARFVPARDEVGKPVAGTWATTVNWQIPDDDYEYDENDEGSNVAPQPGYLVITMVVEADGTVSDCTVERAEGEAARMFPNSCPYGRQVEPILDVDGNPQRTRIRMMFRLVHEPLPD